ncbi:MAG TPA: hypothetical protein VGW38_07545, partial [Chloroflexota bacterium]|nr:hypothetical protein [Chloroflexota bacterium]
SSIYAFVGMPIDPPGSKLAVNHEEPSWAASTVYVPVIVTVPVSSSNGKPAQAAMRAYLSTEGTESITAALRATPSFGVAEVDSRVMGAWPLRHPTALQYAWLLEIFGPDDTP